MRRTLRALLTVLVVSVPVLTSAQDTGTRIHNHPQAVPGSYNTLSEATRGRLTMLDFARCLIVADEKGARTFASTFPETPGYEKLGRRLSTNECLGDGTLAFNTTLLRASIYTVLYQKEFGRSLVPLHATPLDYNVETVGQDSSKINEYVVLRQFAECVVRAAPEPARQIVLGPVGSEREEQAFAVLGPYMGPCLVKGSEVKFGRTALIGLIAEVLYRLSASAPIVSVAGKP